MVVVQKIKYCPCQIPEKTQKHHLLRKGLRKRLKKISVDKITVFWIKGPIGNEKEVSTKIPINTYVKFCDECHKLAHPENLNYHLNELVVKSLKEKEKENA